MPNIIKFGGASADLSIQYGRATATNFIGTQTVDKDLGSARPCYVYAGGYNRYNLWIYGSNNNSTWTQLATASLGSNVAGEISAKTSSYRYIRAAADGINNGGHNSLFMSVTYI